MLLGSEVELSVIGGPSALLCPRETRHGCILKDHLSTPRTAAGGSPVSHTLCSKHFSSSFQVSRYSSRPQGRHTLSEVAVHLEDMYVP